MVMTPEQRAERACVLRRRRRALTCDECGRKMPVPRGHPWDLYIQFPEVGREKGYHWNMLVCDGREMIFCTLECYQKWIGPIRAARAEWGRVGGPA